MKSLTSDVATHKARTIHEQPTGAWRSQCVREYLRERLTLEAQVG